MSRRVGYIHTRAGDHKRAQNDDRPQGSHRVGRVVHDGDERAHAREVPEVGAAEERECRDVVDDVLLEVLAPGLDAQVDGLVHLWFVVVGEEEAAGEKGEGWIDRSTAHKSWAARRRLRPKTLTYIDCCLKHVVPICLLGHHHARVVLPAELHVPVFRFGLRGACMHAREQSQNTGAAASIRRSTRPSARINAPGVGLRGYILEPVPRHGHVDHELPRDLVLELTLSEWEPLPFNRYIHRQPFPSVPRTSVNLCSALASRLAFRHRRM